MGIAQVPASQKKMQIKLILLLIAISFVAGDLTKPDVNLGTEYFPYKNKNGQSVAAYEVYRINAVLQWGLTADNAASSSGEMGFILLQYGQTSGYILKYCVEMVFDNPSNADILKGNDDLFAMYECCNGGNCTPCNYTGSGTNTTKNMVGRSYALDVPTFGTQSAKYGWWYSFPPGGDCGNNEVGTNGCTYRASPIVDVVRLQDINVLKEWYANPTNFDQWQVDNNIMVNAFDDDDYMKAYLFNATQNVYYPLHGSVKPSPKNQCRAQCPEGTYSSTGYLQGFSADTCIKCPIGTYAKDTGSKSCESCPQGYTTNAAGATSDSHCYPITANPCDPGSYNEDTGHEPCNKCPANTYQTLHSATSCTQCPTFTSSSSVGATSVASCDLNPPRAMFVYDYHDSAIPTSLSGRIAANSTGEINFLQSSMYGETIALSGTVTRRCVEAVDVPFSQNTFSCWGSYCTYPSNQQNLVVSGFSGYNGNPAGSYNSPNNGEWYYFPAKSECSTLQKPGDAGCTWKSATIMETATLHQLHDQGLYSCALASTGWCWAAMTPAQWQNSVEAMDKFSKIANVTSSVTSKIANEVSGPVHIENGRCVVDCPTGYVFRSAFTAPYCVKAGTSSMFASINDGEQATIDDSNGQGVIAATSVAAVVVVAGVAVFIAVRIYKRRQFIILP